MQRTIMQFLTQKLTQKLDKQKNLNLYRSRTSLTMLSRKRVVLKCQNQDFISFINNDYLGLAKHPAVINAFQKGAKRYGIGSSASALLGGYYDIHQRLEEKISTFLGYERTLIFSSGYLANLAVLTTFLNKEEAIFEDRLNHASLIDAGRYSFAKFKRYHHLDMKHLENYLKRAPQKNKWIVSDGVFSMNGDMAPISTLIELSKQYNAALLIDDAHGIGVLGTQGKGSLEHQRVSPENITVLVGTFGKAFGTQGAFVSGSTVLIESLIQFARSYIYTTALSPAIACATEASLAILQEESFRRDHLQLLINQFIQGAQQLNLPVFPSKTPIQTLILKNTDKTMEVDIFLKQHHILVGAIRPPTVPPNTSRLRINLTALHTEKEVEYLLVLLAKAGEKFNFV